MSLVNESSKGDGPRIYVLGAIRNGEKTLKSAVRDIERFVGSEVVSQWFIVESDSEDKTLVTLSQIAAEVKGFCFDSLGSLMNTVPNRVARIAIARQRALESAIKTLSEEDLVIVADLDGITSSLPAGGLLRARSRLESFDVITANSKSRYYDVLALRAEGWVEEDYRLTRQRLLEQGLSPLEAHNESLVKKQRKIRQTASPIEVQSAFGGLAIYSGKAFLSGTYQFDAQEECEHVGFHRELAKKGFRICVDPGLIAKPEWRHAALSSPLFSLPWRLVVKLSVLLPKSLSHALARKVFD